MQLKTPPSGGRFDGIELKLKFMFSLFRYYLLEFSSLDSIFSSYLTRETKLFFSAVPCANIQYNYLQHSYIHIDKLTHTSIAA